MCDGKSLAHTNWNCKYHIVFAPKYRRQVFYGEKKVAVGDVLRKLCEWQGVNIVEAECCPDHIHMLLGSVDIHKLLWYNFFILDLKRLSTSLLPFYG